LTMTDEERARRLDLLNTVFRPSAPVDSQDLFSGRIDQLASVQDAVGAVGQHAVIFGERGVGKTSVAATCVAIARHGGRMAMRINCDQGDNFYTLWQKVIDEFAVAVNSAREDLRPSLTKAVEAATEVLSFGEDIGPNRVRVALRNITSVAPVVIFFDEFDQICDDGTLSLVSNTIKLLSDQVENVTLIPVGVSENVGDLIASHISIQRNLVQVRMPRMSRDEIEGILDNGLSKLGMTIDESGRRFVRIVPRGLPQYAHLLAQEGARHALLLKEATITFKDVFQGMKVGLRKLDHTLASAFDEATYTARRSNYADVLYACVWGRPGDDGYFSPASIREPYSMIVGKSRDIDSYNPQLKTLSEGRGQILHRKGPLRSRRYRFSDPLMEPYVLLRGIAAGRIDPRRMLRSDGDPSEPEQPS
jgi:Cdc6-like AAA superfamily ATPase